MTQILMTPEWTLDTSCRKVTLGAAGTSAAAQWSWWNFRGYHHDATLVMAMTVTITMSITVKAIVKIVTFQNPIYWYGFCPLDPIKSFYLSLLKDYKNSEWSVATLWSLFHWFLLLFFQIKSQGWLGDWISLSVQMFQIILRLSGTLLDRVPTWLPEASGLVNLTSILDHTCWK